MSSASTIAKPIPFDARLLDKLMDGAGLDVIVATSKHNVQYMLGGYRFFFFDTMEAMGVSRYLSAVVYRKGKPEDTAYIGCVMEAGEKELGKFWTPKVELGSVGSQVAMDNVAAHIAKLSGVRRVGTKPPFSPRTRASGSGAAFRTPRWSMRIFRSSDCARARRQRKWRFCAKPRNVSSTRCERHSKPIAYLVQRRPTWSKPCGARK